MTLRKFSPVLILICLLLFIYSPAINNFFSADDWFHLKISTVSNLTEVGQFFSFTPNSHTASFYRPLSTQVFFGIFYSLFGLNPLPYHLFVILIFSFSLYLIYRVTIKLAGDKKIAFWTAFFYGFSATNFTRLFFLSAFQEVLMMFFVLLCFNFYLNKRIAKNITFSLIMFGLALLSKESAVVTPLLLLLVGQFTRKKISKSLIPFFLMMLIYLFIRLTFFGFAQGDSYVWDFRPFKILNTTLWYSLWSFGVPEFLVDYVSPGFRVVPRLFQVLPVWSNIILTLSILIIINFSSLFWLNIKKDVKKIFLSGAIFLIGLLPVIFLPFHKFSLELTLPLLGFCLLLSFLCFQKFNKLITFSFVVIFLMLNLSTYFLSFSTNYSISRAKISKKVYNYVQTYYPNLNQNQKLLFTNGNIKDGGQWGISKQIALSVSTSDMFNVIYKDKSIVIHYEDLEENLSKNDSYTEIDSLQFLKD